MPNNKQTEMDCPSCKGFGEVMVRFHAIDSDGSQDIGTTPYLKGCHRCNRTGKIKKI